MKKLCTVFLLILITQMVISAQETFPRNGVMDHRERFYALTGVSVHIDLSCFASVRVFFGNSAICLFRQGKPSDMD